MKDKGRSVKPVGQKEPAARQVRSCPDALGAALRHGFRIVHWHLTQAG